MKNVAGIFNSKIVADNAVSELLDAGFAKDDISLLMSDKTRNEIFSSTDDEADRAAKGGVTGAVIGGALGALIAGLVAAGSIVTSGGVLLVAGPIVAALAGAGAGGTAGGIAGALISAGFAADEANRYDDEIKRGKAIVLVHARDAAEAARAHTALEDSGATFKAA
jgi:hypothetical protein